MAPVRLTSYYGKRKRGGTYGGSSAKKPYIRTMAVARAPISTRPGSSSIHKVFQGVMNIAVGIAAEVGSTGFIPVNVLPEVHKNVINAFGQVKLAYVVVEMLDAFTISDNTAAAIEGGCACFALSDGRAVPAAASDVIAVYPNCRTSPFKTLEYSNPRLKIMYKPVTEAERSWMSAATFFEPTRKFFDAVVGVLDPVAIQGENKSVAVTLRYSVKLECMMA